MVDHLDEAPGTGTPNDLDSFWVPFTPNRQFKANPRIVVSAKGMALHFPMMAVRSWTAHPAFGVPISAIVIPKSWKPCKKPWQRSTSHLPFNSAILRPSSLLPRVGTLMPDDLNRVFFCNSGSEAVDTALKIALAYHRAKGDAGRYRLIGRERGLSRRWLRWYCCWWHGRQSQDFWTDACWR